MDDTTTQTAQTVSVIDLLPKINPEHEAFFRQFVPAKHMGVYGHREFDLVSIALEAKGDTVAVYELALPATNPSCLHVISYEYRIKGCALVERERCGIQVEGSIYAKSRASAFAKYGRR